MSPDGNRHQLGQDAAPAGEGACSEPGPKDFGPETTGNHRLTASQWGAVGDLPALKFVCMQQ
jgi:hypothetical protein